MSKIIDSETTLSAKMRELKNAPKNKQVQIYTAQRAYEYELVDSYFKHKKGVKGAFVDNIVLETNKMLDLLISCGHVKTDLNSGQKRHPGVGGYD